MGIGYLQFVRYCAAALGLMTLFAAGCGRPVPPLPPDEAPAVAAAPIPAPPSLPPTPPPPVAPAPIAVSPVAPPVAPTPPVPPPPPPVEVKKPVQEAIPAAALAAVPRPSPAERRKLEGHTGMVRTVAFSPDGKRLVSGGDDKTVRLWDVNTGLEIARLDAGSGVYKVAYAPDGLSVAAALTDRQVRVWEVDSRKELHRLEHKDVVTAVAYSHDGATILSAGRDSGAYLWDVKAGKLLRRLTEPRRPEQLVGMGWSVAYTSSGRSALAMKQSGLYSWDATTGRLRATMPAGTALATWRKGPLALLGETATIDEIKHGVVALYHLDQRRYLGRFNAHAGDITSVAISPDGQRALSSAYDSLVLYWDLAPATKLPAKRPPPAFPLKGIPDQPYQTTQPLTAFHGHRGGVLSVAIDPTGKLGASGGSDRTIRLWDLEDGIPLGQIGDLVEWLEWELWTITRRRVLVAGFEDFGVRLWDVVGRREIHKFDGHAAQVVCLALSEDAGLAAAAALDGMVIVWEVETGKIRWRLKAHTGAVRRIAFAPKGDLLLSGGVDGVARVWRMDDGKESHRFENHVGGVTAVSFQPDGRFLLTGAADGTIRLIDANTGAEARRYETLKGPVARFAFSEEGRQLLVGSSERTVEMWDILTGKNLGAPPVGNEWVSKVLTAWDVREVPGQLKPTGPGAALVGWLLSWKTVPASGGSGVAGRRTITTTRTTTIRTIRRR